MQASLTLDHINYPVSRFEITEAVSRAWRGTVVVVSDFTLDCENLLRKYCQFDWQDDSGRVRQWVGIALGCEVSTLAPNLIEYRWLIGSFLNTVKQPIIPYTTYCQQNTKSTVMQALDHAHAWSIVQEWRLSTRLPVYPMAVQVNESTYDFIARRCAMDNIVWYSHTQDGVECITFIDDHSLMATWPVITMNGVGEHKTHLCFSARDAMPQVSDWEDLPIDRLYRGVPSVGAGHTVPGVGMSDAPYFTSFDCKGTDACVSIMSLIRYDRSLYRVQYVTHYGTRREGKLDYQHDAVIVDLHHPWRGVSPRRPKMPALLQGVVESHSEAPALDEQGRVYVKMLADTRSIPPCTASVGIPYCGTTFPLQPGTNVAVSCLSDDPDRPVIVGVISSDLEKDQHKLVTPAGHELKISDHPAAPTLRLGNRDLGLSMRSGDSHEIAITCIGGMIVEAKGECRMKAGERWSSTVNGMAVYQARASHQIQAQERDISLQAAKNIHIDSKLDSAIAVQKNLNHTVNARHQARAARGKMMTVSKGDMQVGVQGNCHILMQKNMNIKAKSLQICAGNNLLGLMLSPEGVVTLHGKRMRFDCNTLTLQGRMHMGGQQSIPSLIQSLPAAPVAPIPSSTHHLSPKIRVRYPNVSLTYEPSRHSIDYQYATQQGSEWIWGAMQRIAKVECDHPLKPVVLGRERKVRIWSTETTQIVCQQTGRPISCVTADLSILTDERVIDILCLPPPIMVNVRQDRASHDRHARNVLSQAEINYFKENGGNATLFIHGFNVDYGEYGSHQKMSHWLRQHIHPKKLKNAQQAEATAPYSVRHDYHDLITSDDLKILRHAKRYHANRVTHPLREQFYDKGGGEGAHSWCVNMEYNMNARSGFAGDYRDPHYSRIIGVAWSGDVPVPYYMAAEHYADMAAARLLHLIRQLVKAQIKIHMVAHSLGNRVLLILLHTLACDPAYRQCIETAFLWQAAVPDTAIIDMKGIDTSIKQNWKTYYAIHAVKYMRVLYSDSDVSTLGVSYEAATKLGVSPACFVKQASYCPPDDNQALLIHGGNRRPLTGRLHVRPPLGLRGDKGYQGDFKAIGEAFRDRYKNKLSFIDLSEVSQGHSYMKVKDYISSADIYSRAFELSTYRLGNYYE